MAEGSTPSAPTTDHFSLFVSVRPNVSKLFRMRYTLDGREKLLSFGAYPKISLAQAREKRDAARALLRDCIDPAGVPVLKALPETDPQRQFEAVAREWHVQTKKRWTRKYAADALASLKTHVFPKLGKHDIDKITVPEMLDVMREVEKPGAFDLAHRVRQRCSGIFLHGIASGLCISDPAGVVARALHPVIKSRQPAITSLKDARDMLVKVENALCYPITKLASRALALTSVRPGDLRCME